MSQAHNIPNQYTTGVTLDPSAKTSTANGASVDLVSCEADTLLEVQIGAVTGTTPTCDIKLQESVDNSTWSDISSATLDQLTDADANTMQQLLVWNRAARYVRAVFTIGGTTPSFTMSANIRSKKKFD